MRGVWSPLWGRSCAGWIAEVSRKTMTTGPYRRRDSERCRSTRTGAPAARAGGDDTAVTFTGIVGRGPASDARKR
jgi:hypothetical protein